MALRKASRDTPTVNRQVHLPSCFTLTHVTVGGCKQIH